MSRFLDATCDAQGVVRCQGFVLNNVHIMGEGKAESQGYLFLDGLELVYIPKATDDLISTLDKISAALDKIATGIEKLDTAGYVIAVVGDASGTPATPFAAAEISAIRSLKAELDSLKGALK